MSFTLDRTTVLRGPAVIVFDGVAITTKGDVTVTDDLKTFNVESSHLGKIDEREDTFSYKVAFTPDGTVSDDILGKLFPFYTRPYGSSVMGADKSLLIHSLTDGKQLTYFGAAVTKMPDLDFSGKRPLFGSTEISAVGKNNTVNTDAAKRLAIATASYTAPGVVAANILTQPYAVGWAPSGSLAAFQTQDGIKVAHNLALTAEDADGPGLYDWTFGGLDVTARLQPLGVTKEDILAASTSQGAGAGRGRSLAATAHDLTISGAGLYFVLYGAALKAAPFAFGLTTKHVGEVQFVSTRKLVSGVPQPIAYLGTTAPA